MARCLVTGHLGYIGSHLFEELKKQGHDVFGIDLKQENILSDFENDIRMLITPDKIKWGKTQQYDYIFHMAAFPRVEYSVENPTDTFSHNVYGTQCVLDFAHQCGVKRVIFSSSSAIYGNGKGPTSPYGLQKLQSEMLCKFYSEFYGLDTISLRYFNVYSEDQPTDGAYSTVIAAWIGKIKNGEPLKINGDGEHRRDFIHVDDIVQANIKAMEEESRFKGLAVDIGTGKNYSLNEIKQFIEAGDQSIRFIFGPEREGDAKTTLADIRYQNSSGWVAKVSFEEGLQRCFPNKK